MPYRSRPEQPRNLIAQIEDEMRERLQEAIDRVSLEVLVETRRARGQPHPTADNAGDRAEFEAGVRAFLERLDRDVPAGVDDRLQRTLTDVRARAGADPAARLLAAQVALARALPDYWQRFETAHHAFAEERVRSGGQRRSLLRQLFGR